MRKKPPIALIALVPFFYLMAAVALVAILSTNGVYPSGTDTLYHLYRGDAVFRSLQQGILFPFYDPMWANGTELLRFSSPVCGYLLAVCQTLAGGSMFNGYLLFVGVLFYLEALSFFRLGLRASRPVLGSLLGVLWFLWPHNLQILFVLGDLPRALASLFLPGLLGGILFYLSSHDWKQLPRISLSLFLMCLTHIGAAAMTLLCIGLLLFVCKFLARVGSRFWHVLLALLSGLLLAGPWLIPYLTSGILSREQSDAMAVQFQPLLSSLDLKHHLSGFDAGVPYFGIGLLLVLLLCALLSQRPAAAPAWAAALLLPATTSGAYLFLRIIPGSQHLRMLWVFPTVCALCFLALLAWRSSRLPVLVVLCLLLCLDSLPTLSLIYGSGLDPTTAESRMSASMSRTLLNQAQSQTTHRLAILDEGNMGSLGVSLASAYDEPIPVSGGDGDACVSTGDRLSRIGRALTNSHYLYAFDRCLEMGCDTVLVQAGIITPLDLVNGQLDRAAAWLGYTPSNDQGAYRLYHIDLGSGWGLVSRYSAIGIGDTAYYTSLAFPSMEETTDPNLEHYTLEQLQQYELVYLSGFTYDERASAEALVLALGEAGVRVVIDADGIPESRETHDKSFLSVLCDPIQFSNGYPGLDTVYGSFDPDPFLPGYATWDTYFLNGLDDVRGTMQDNNISLPIYGTTGNENISVVGLNLFYHYTLTQDAAVGQFLSQVLGIPFQRLPSRQVVPLGVSYGPGSITFTTPEDRVNTTLAYHSFFTSDAPLYSVNGLLWVDAGETTVSLHYPDPVPSAAAFLVGLLLLVCLTYAVRIHSDTLVIPLEDDGGEDFPPPGGDATPADLYSEVGPTPADIPPEGVEDARDLSDDPPAGTEDAPDSFGAADIPAPDSFGAADSFDIPHAPDPDGEEEVQP